MPASKRASRCDFGQHYEPNGPRDVKRWRSNPIHWPKKIDTTGFDHSLSIARNLVVRRDTTRVYVAGCEGLRCLSKELGVPLFKIGTTSADLLQRLAEISADRYAAAYSLNDETIVDQEFDHWKLMSMDFSLPRAVESPVWIEPRALRVTLPKMLSGKQFEERLREAARTALLGELARNRRGSTPFGDARDQQGARRPLHAVRVWG